MCAVWDSGLHGKGQRVKAPSECSKWVVNSVSLSRDLPVFPGFFEIIRVFEHKNNVLFTGDTLMGKGFFSGIPQYTDPVAYIKSMEKLKKLSPDVVYSCHNEPLDGKILASKAQEGIDTVESIENWVETYLKDKSSDTDLSLRNLVAFVCEKQGKSVGGGACVSVMSHIRRLKLKYPIVEKIIHTHEEE